MGQDSDLKIKYIQDRDLKIKYINTLEYRIYIMQKTIEVLTERIMQLEPEKKEK